MLRPFAGSNEEFKTATRLQSLYPRIPLYCIFHLALAHAELIEVH